MRKFEQRAFIDGFWTVGWDEKTFPVLNPATGAEIARVPDLGPDAAIAAIKAALGALPAWRDRTGKERARLLRDLFYAIMVNKEALARLISEEGGKVLREARSEVEYAASYVEWFAEEAKRTYGETVPETVAGRRLWVNKEAVGVCALITPWNFPAAMVTRKLAPALAAGCTVVLKPSEHTPLTALALAELCNEVGIPPGVVNVVTASQGAGIGTAFCTSEAVRKISFTGSTNVGRMLMRESASSIKKLSLELGGNAPFIVFDDANLEAAVSGAIASKFRHSGQTCVSANRFLVQSGIYEAFRHRLCESASALSVNWPESETADIGPLISGAAVSKVCDLVDEAISEGACIISGGRASGFAANYFEPTIIEGVNTGMRIAREEIFGPVAVLMKFETEDEAIALANSTEAGLASYVYSQNVERIFRVIRRLEFGMVGINEGILSTEVAPFGGIKTSGLGREGSRHGIEDYMELKYVCLGGLGPSPK